MPFREKLRPLINNATEPEIPCKSSYVAINTAFKLYRSHSPENSVKNPFLRKTRFLPVEKRRKFNTYAILLINHVCQIHQSGGYFSQHYQMDKTQYYVAGHKRTRE